MLIPLRFVGNGQVLHLHLVLVILLVFLLQLLRLLVALDLLQVDAAAAVVVAAPEGDERGGLPSTPADWDRGRKGEEKGENDSGKGERRAIARNRGSREAWGFRPKSRKRTCCPAVKTLFALAGYAA